MKQSLILLSLMIYFQPLWAAYKITDSGVPISHCYHWLKEASQKRLTQKYEYANKNNGDFYSFTTTTGNAKGDGIYCSKEPTYTSDFGDRVIRIDFVADLVLADETATHRNYCGFEAKQSLSIDECNKKTPDVILYQGSSAPGNHANYVIKNPKAIKKWTSNDAVLLQELIDTRAAATQPRNVDIAISEIKKEIAQGIKHTYINGKSRNALPKFTDLLVLYEKNQKELFSEIKSILNQRWKEVLSGTIGEDPIFIFAGPSRSHIQSQCKEFVEKNKNKLEEKKTIDIIFSWNTSDNAELKTIFSNEFCEEIKKISNKNLESLEKKIALVEMMRKNFEQPTQASLELNMSNTLEKINLSADNQSDFILNCTTALKMTDLGKESDLNLSYGSTKKNIKYDSSSSFCLSLIPIQADLKKQNERMAAFNEMKTEFTPPSGFVNIIIPAVVQTDKFYLNLSASSEKEFMSKCDIAYEFGQLGKLSSFSIRSEPQRTILNQGQLKDKKQFCQRVLHETRMTEKSVEIKDSIVRGKDNQIMLAYDQDNIKCQEDLKKFSTEEKEQFYYSSFRKGKVQLALLKENFCNSIVEEAQFIKNVRAKNLVAVEGNFDNDVKFSFVAADKKEAELRCYMSLFETNKTKFLKINARALVNDRVKTIKYNANDEDTMIKRLYLNIDNFKNYQQICAILGKQIFPYQE